jgi:hypothetical protein
VGGWKTNAGPEIYKLNISSTSDDNLSHCLVLPGHAAAPIAAWASLCRSFLYELKCKSMQEELNTFWHQWRKEYEEERKKVKKEHVELQKR